jgi:MoaA/NifB/PqqE/SkfB family radical SAM enzyme
MSVRTINFFNIGEPFLSPNVSTEIRVLREHNPNAQIVTSTNGVFLNSREKMESALLLDHIYFSIDGCIAPVFKQSNQAA